MSNHLKKYDQKLLMSIGMLVLILLCKQLQYIHENIYIYIILKNINSIISIYISNRVLDNEWNKNHTLYSKK